MDIPSACADVDAHVRTPGQVTLGTSDPASPPWWGGDPTTHYTVQPSGASGWSIGNPYSMEGFDAGVAYSIINAMGYQADQVRWVKTDFGSDEVDAVANVDFAVGNIAVASGDSAVAFSQPYLTTSEAVVGVDGNAATSSTKVADLAALRLGARTGSGGERLIDSLIHPSTPASLAPDDLGLAKQLRDGAVDAVVVDVDVARYLRDGSTEDQFDGAPLKDGVIVGQVAPELWQDQIAVALAPASPLLECVNAAIATSETQSLISEYQTEDLGGPGDLPVLR